jgi:transcription antitermination factor NusA-like protein
MASTIDMKHLMYIKLFGSTTRIETRHCFDYNNTIVFAVPKPLISRALGKDAENLRKMSGIMKKRVRVVAQPLGDKDIKSFISAIISPVKFNEIEIKDNEVILTAGSQNKAALLGRNKRRLLEMQSIIKSFFRKDFRIV